MRRSFWRSAHVRYFSQLNFSSSSAILLQHLEAGQNNTKCQQPALLSIRQLVKAGYDKFMCLWVGMWVHLQFSEFRTTWRSSVCGFSLFYNKGGFWQWGRKEQRKGQDEPQLAALAMHLLHLFPQLGWRLGHHPQLCRTPLGASHLLSLKRESEQSVWDKVWISLKFCPRYLWVFGAQGAGKMWRFAQPLRWTVAQRSFIPCR